MDLATLIGPLSGLAAALVAIFMGGDFMTFVNLSSILIVVGGAIAATILRFTLGDVLTALNTGISTALGQNPLTPQALIDQVAELARPQRLQEPPDRARQRRNQERVPEEGNPAVRRRPVLRVHPERPDPRPRPVHRAAGKG